jgi:hypothetical protein
MRATVAITLIHTPVEKEGDEKADTGLPGVQPPHAAYVQHESAYAVVLESVSDDLQRAALSGLQ